MKALPLTSLRVQVIIIIAILTIVPVLLLGSAGILFYRDVIKHNIWDDNLAQAKAISALTTNYVDLSENYLNSIAVRPIVISAIEGGDSNLLNVSTEYAAVQGLEFDSVFITDSSGKVLSYSSLHPDTTRSQIGMDYYRQPYVSQVLETSSPYVSDAVHDVVENSTTVYVSVPIVNSSNATIGVLAGTLDLMNFTRTVVGTQVKNSQYVYLVNRTGHVMVHGNKSYMYNMADFSMLPAVQDVIRGSEGVVEEEFPFEGNVQLAAYAPVKKYGWGVVVAIPVNVAYQPITEFTWFFAALLVVLLLVAVLLSLLFGDYLTKPILRISAATAQIPGATPDSLERSLPLGRRDEIGRLARSIMAMSGLIRADRERITSARDQAKNAMASMEKERDRAEEERHRAELYVDIMGHDINNLNQSALGYLEMVRAGENLTEAQREMIDHATRSVMSSAGIIDNVRKLQMISEERHTEKADIDQMIQACIRGAPRPEGKKVTIRYEPMKGLCVNGTPLLKEVFCNLIENSIKHSGDEVEIDIRITEETRDNKKVYEIALSDNGYGIPDEIRQRLFLRFQRGTTKAYGKGLGLYIAKKLLEKNGGSIRIMDRVPGDYTQGTVFVVTLPACD